MGKKATSQAKVVRDPAAAILIISLSLDRHLFTKQAYVREKRPQIVTNLPHFNGWAAILQSFFILKF
jgi:hypothetical protein